MDDWKKHYSDEDKPLSKRLLQKIKSKLTNQRDQVQKERNEGNRERTLRLLYNEKYEEKQKEKARERDNFVCQDCGATNSRDVHHKKPKWKFRTGIVNGDPHELSNLKTVCRSCHKEYPKHNLLRPEKGTDTPKAKAEKPLSIASAIYKLIFRPRWRREVLKSFITGKKVNFKEIDRVAVGATVILEMNDKKEKYTIVNPSESNIEDNKISIDSPIGKAIQGHHQGETVHTETPKGKLTIRIVDVLK
ncbi:GreA/GreB family elongation factor [Candidatus Bipolaricaulota bacterium]|nr:GreA/GreB family elongation factor [Candidatus Bipolaricaulota bacterium]